MDDTQISGRDIAAKTFLARTKRGYDPSEVDAYLLTIARQVDQLHEQLEQQRLSDTDAFSPAPAPERSEAEQESVELMLRIAKKTSEEVLTEARTRADEIVAEANFRAAQIGRESDRKAFEAASRTQAELQGIERDVSTRRGELARLDGVLAERQEELRGMAASINRLADELVHDDVLVDLTDEAPITADVD